MTAAVEGDTDVPVIQRLLALFEMQLGDVFGLNGKDRLDASIRAYNNTARFSPWLVLRDLNADAPCPSELLRVLLPRPAPLMCMRLAVRASEAWLIADRHRMSDYLSVPLSRIPDNPDSSVNPEQLLVDLARRSRRSAVRDDMVPYPGTSARVGPGYTARVIEFAVSRWRPRVAAECSWSLARSIAAVGRWYADKISPWARGRA